MYTPRNPNDPRQVEACQLRAEGMTYQAIADRFGCSKQNIRNWTNPDARAYSDAVARRIGEESRAGKRGTVNKVHYRAVATAAQCRQRGDHCDSERYTINRMYRIAAWANHFSGAVHGDPGFVEVDHITPLSRGGTSHLSNLQFLTSSENQLKGSS